MSRRHVQHSGRGRASRRGVRAKRRSRRRENGTGRGRRADSSADGWIRHGTALPGWSDLEPSRNRRRTSSESSFLQHISTVRFALLILAVAGAFTLYVGHVHATTDLLNQLQEARAENRRLQLEHNRLQGQYDRRTSPSVIYRRAREMGLRASVTYGPPISLDE